MRATSLHKPLATALLALCAATGSHATYVNANPLGNVDPEGLDVVVITGGAREATNPFGHTAIGVSGGGVYSYGNSTSLGSAPLSYLQSQSQFRNQQITIIPRTSAQDAAAMANLSANGCRNCVGVFDNCAVRTDSALRASGVSTNMNPFPGGVARDARNAPGAVNYYLPRGAAVPASLREALTPFNPPNVP